VSLRRLWGLGTVGRLEDPTFTVKTALIFTPYPGATAQDVETEVSEVIESALQQMQQLDYVTSKSTPGLSQVTVEIKTTYDGGELPQVWDEMRLRLRDLRADLPSGARDPTINDDFGDVYGLFYAVETQGRSPAEQREIARSLRRGLLPVEGVARVEIQGLIDEEITVEIPSARLTSLGLPPTQLLSVIDDENEVFVRWRDIRGHAAAAHFRAAGLYRHAGNRRAAAGGAGRCRPDRAVRHRSRVARRGRTARADHPP